MDSSSYRDIRAGRWRLESHRLPVRRLFVWTLNTTSNEKRTEGDVKTTARKTATNDTNLNVLKVIRMQLIVDLDVTMIPKQTSTTWNHTNTKQTQRKQNAHDKRVANEEMRKVSRESRVDTARRQLLIHFVVLSSSSSSFQFRLVQVYRHGMFGSQ